MNSIFGSSKPLSPASGLNATQNSQVKKQVEEQISQELAMVHANELVSKLTDNCFQRCILQPSSSLTGVEETCVSQCMEKYMRAWNVISRSYISRIQQGGAK